MENIRLKVIFKSFFVLVIFNLGCVVKFGIIMVNLNIFYLDIMVWLIVDILVEFQILKDLFGQGGFRKVYRVKINI